MAHDYIVYKDEDGNHGYAPRSFYEGAKELLDFVIIINKKNLLGREQARKLSEKLNGDD